MVPLPRAVRFTGCFVRVTRKAPFAVDPAILPCYHSANPIQLQGENGMKKVMVMALALMLALAALPGYAADRGVYMRDNIAWAQMGWPGILERFEGDMDAVEAYVTSPIANQQGAGISYHQMVVAGGAVGPSGPVYDAAYWTEVFDGLGIDMSLYHGSVDEQFTNGNEAYVAFLGSGGGLTGYYSVGDTLYKYEYEMAQPGLSTHEVVSY